MTGRIRGLPVVVAVREDGTRLVARGRDAETLAKLVEKGARGVRAYDFQGGPPFRLPAYVLNLRKLGLVIRTEREPHDCGSHGRFILETLVHIEGGAP